MLVTLWFLACAWETVGVESGGEPFPEQSALVFVGPALWASALCLFIVSLASVAPLLPNAEQDGEKTTKEEDLTHGQHYR